MSKVQFAQLDKGLNLHHDDFMAIAFSRLLKKLLAFADEA
jgi:hypothetical protein